MGNTPSGTPQNPQDVPTPGSGVEKRRPRSPETNPSKPDPVVGTKGVTKQAFEAALMARRAPHVYKFPAPRQQLWRPKLNKGSKPDKNDDNDDSGAAEVG